MKIVLSAFNDQLRSDILEVPNTTGPRYRLTIAEDTAFQINTLSAGMITYYEEFALTTSEELSNGETLYIYTHVKRPETIVQPITVNNPYTEEVALTLVPHDQHEGFTTKEHPEISIGKYFDGYYLADRTKKPKDKYLYTDGTWHSKCNEEYGKFKTPEDALRILEGYYAKH